MRKEPLLPPFLVWVEGFRSPKLQSQSPLVLLGIDRKDRQCPSHARDLASHQANGTHADNSHRFASYRLGHHGVHCVAERIEDGGNLVGYFGRYFPDVGCRKREIVRKAAVPIYPDDGHFPADVALARPAEKAVSAPDMSLARYDVAGL